MREEQKPDSAPMPMPAPQLPNIPISPDDPFQSDPDLLPPVKPLSDRDPAPGGHPPGRWPGQAPRRNDPDDFESEPDDSETALQRFSGRRPRVLAGKPPHHAPAREDAGAPT
ncbi:MAG: hypothetical protein MOB07_00230 [Acidobacteria bacterium]|nr:hypothetical protein [Acidobacteriota bacterium]